MPYTLHELRPHQSRHPLDKGPARSPEPMGLDPEEFDTDKRYTIWERVGDSWVIDRSHYGAFYKSDDVTEWRISQGDRLMVLEEGYEHAGSLSNAYPFFVPNPEYEYTPTGTFEVFYSSGGHGGPYKTEEAARERAERVLMGGRDLTVIVVPSEADWVNTPFRKLHHLPGAFAMHEGRVRRNKLKGYE